MKVKTLLIFLILTSAVQGRSISQRMYEGRSRSRLICKALQSTLPKILNRINDNDVVGHDVHKRPAQDGHLLAPSGFTMYFSPSIMSTYQYYAATSAADLCDTLLDVYTAAITQARGVQNCVNSNPRYQVNPLAVTGGVDAYFLAYNMIADHYVHAVHDYMKIKRGHKRLFKFFKNEAQALQSVFKAKLSFLHPMARNLENELSDYKTLKQQCEQKSQKLLQKCPEMVKDLFKQEGSSIFKTSRHPYLKKALDKTILTPSNREEQVEERVDEQDKHNDSADDEFPERIVIEEPEPSVGEDLVPPTGGIQGAAATCEPHFRDIEVSGRLGGGRRADNLDRAKRRKRNCDHVIAQQAHDLQMNQETEEQAAVNDQELFNRLSNPPSPAHSHQAPQSPERCITPEPRPGPSREEPQPGPSRVRGFDIQTTRKTTTYVETVEEDFHPEEPGFWSKNCNVQ